MALFMLIFLSMTRMSVAAPPSVRPIKELLLMIAFFLVLVLLYLIVRQKDIKINKPGKKAVFPVFVVILLMITILGIFVYQPPVYFYPHRYSLSLALTDSSGGFTLNDFQINGQQIVSHYPGQNSTSVYDLEPDSIEHFMLYCNKTDIFWGARSIELNLYVSFHEGNNGILYYHNMSNEYTVKEFGSRDHWVRTPIDVFFDNGLEWVNFEVRISSPPVY